MPGKQFRVQWISYAHDSHHDIFRIDIFKLIRDIDNIAPETRDLDSQWRSDARRQPVLIAAGLAFRLNLAVAVGSNELSERNAHGWVAIQRTLAKRSKLPIRTWTGPSRLFRESVTLFDYWATVESEELPDQGKPIAAH